MYIGLHINYSLLFSDFNETLSTWTEGKIFIYQMSWKSFQWEPSYSVRTDRHTDTMKLILAFCSFVNAPKHHSLRFITSYFCTYFHVWWFDYDHSLHFPFLKHRWTSSKFCSFMYLVYIFISSVRRFWLRRSTAALYFWVKCGKTQAALQCFWESIWSWPSQIKNLVAATKRTRRNGYSTLMFRTLMSVSSVLPNGKRFAVAALVYVDSFTNPFSSISSLHVWDAEIW